MEVLDECLAATLLAMGLAINVQDVLGEGFVTRCASEVLLEVLVAIPLDRFITWTKLDTSLVAAWLASGTRLCAH